MKGIVINWNGIRSFLHTSGLFLYLYFCCLELDKNFFLIIATCLLIGFDSTPPTPPPPLNILMIGYFIYLLS